jgi:hypothetical protein
MVQRTFQDLKTCLKAGKFNDSRKQTKTEDQFLPIQQTTFCVLIIRTINNIISLKLKERLTE